MSSYFGAESPISIHSLRGEGDAILSARGSLTFYFNPLPPWGGRLSSGGKSVISFGISIHSLRGEGDGCHGCVRVVGLYFNPLPPWGGRLTAHGIPSYTFFISIHSLRGEGDQRWQRLYNHRNNISIHSLRGEGDSVTVEYGETVKKISIHSLRGEGDHDRKKCPESGKHFNPLPPWGGRHLADLQPFCIQGYFNPLPPWGGRHSEAAAMYYDRFISIHSLRGEGDIILYNVIGVL